MPKLNLGELEIRSQAFGHGESIPKRFTHDGGDTSPELRWSGVPSSAAELALVCHDPDAPLTDGFTHWVVYGIPPDATGIDENGGDRFVQGTNSAGEPGYMGPAPPPGHGRHHYFFHLYALDRRLDAPAGLRREELIDLIDGHIVQQARVAGVFQR